MVVLGGFTIISDLTDDSTVSLFLFQGYPTAQMQPYMQQQYYPSYAYTTQQAGAQGTDIDVFYSFFRLHVLPSFLPPFPSLLHLVHVECDGLLIHGTGKFPFCIYRRSVISMRASNGLS